MAASSSAIPVSCTLQRPPCSPKYAAHSRVSLSSPLSLKFQQNPIIHNIKRTVKEASLKLLDAFVDLTFEFVDQPLLPSQSNFFPVEEIEAAVEVTGSVSGTIPDDFTEGVYVRNGSNPIHGGLKSTSSIFGKTSNIWVEGEGMVHALYFKKQRDGTWLIIYNNKHIETDSLRLEKKNQQQKQKPAFLPSVEGDPAAVLSCFLLNLIRFGSGNRNFSNTNVFEHAGKYYSISETDLFGPLEIDINTLQTLGTWDDVRDAWNKTFTSHPKRAPGTGELVTFGIDGVEPPYFVLGVISADGKKLNHKVDLEFQRCTLCHDIGVTQRYNVILDFPTIIDLNRLYRGGSIIKFEKEKFARIGVMPRYGDADSVRWFEVEPCSMFHIINCYEERDEVIVMGCRAQDSIIPGPDLGVDRFNWFSRGFKLVNPAEKEVGKEEEFGYLVGRPYEWRLNTKTGEVKQRYLIEPQFPMDFPFINDKFTGITNKYGYTQVVDSTASSAAAIAKYGGLAKLFLQEKNLGALEDGQKGEEYIKTEYHMFPKNTFCTGSAFIAKHGAVEEDNGWLITFVHNEDTDVSEVYVIDAENFTSEPVAKITLPCRVPYGFHGAFLPAIPLV